MTLSETKTIKHAIQQEKNLLNRLLNNFLEINNESETMDLLPSILETKRKIFDLTSQLED